MNNELIKLQIPQAICQQIDDWNKRYPAGEQRSGIYEALRLVQEHNNGYLSREWMDAVADYLQLPHIAVYEVATFYTMYYLQPVGKHVLNICTNISCMLNGSDKITDHARKRLGIDFNETSADGKFTLKEVECLGACIAPPVCMLDKTYHENVTPEKLDEILAKVGD